MATAFPIHRRFPFVWGWMVLGKGLVGEKHLIYPEKYSYFVRKGLVFFVQNITILYSP